MYLNEKLQHGMVSWMPSAVSKSKRLWLDRTRNESSSSCTVFGWLRSLTGPLVNKRLELKINNTLDEPWTPTSHAFTYRSTQYAVSTTLQYGYKPISDSALLTVELQATQVMAPTKTPEQLQKEAEEAGWLIIWHEFTWWYPWYRMHFVLNVEVPPYGAVYVDYGWSPLPLGMSFQANNTVFGLILNDVGAEIAVDVILSFAVGYVIQRVVAGLAGKTLAGIAIAIGSYISYSLSSAWFLYATSGNSLKAWLAAFISSAIGSFMDFLIEGLRDVWQWLTAVSRRILGEISHTLNSMWARGLNFFDITGIAFAFIDFALMIGYLSLYKASVG